MRLEQRERSLLVDGAPVANRIASLSGPTRKVEYGSLEETGAGIVRGVMRGRLGEIEYRIEDRWSAGSQGVRLARQIVIGSSGPSSEGLSLELELSLPTGRFRFFLPSACYDYCPVEGSSGEAILSEERMSYPLVMAFDEGGAEAYLLARVTPGARSEGCSRRRGQSRFLHDSEVGALGYRRQDDRERAGLRAVQPYREEPTSRMIDSSLAPFAAFLPPDPARVIEVSYELTRFPAPSFDAACLEAYAHASALVNPVPVEHPAGLAACLRSRLDCLSGLVREWGGHTGLSLNFDPRVGADSSPSGYGTSFNELERGIYPEVLEYGFTGRPLNNAYLLALLGARRGNPGWQADARKIVESYLRACVAKSGFLYTLYDVRRGRAISPFGDPVGSRLHYGVKGAEEGNYVRNMAEAATDLCLFATVALSSSCLRAARAFGDFLLRIQNRDGSWYRAYTPDGRPVLSPEEWFGANERANKSSTSAVIPFLLELERAVRTGEYRKAAIRGGEWLLAEVVERIDYRGGTLDNPNVVDKEGMAYAMSALLRLHEATGAREFLEGARRSGGLALTWNYLWDVPFEPDTRLAEYDFKSRGWGGISILWGAGVVDIYSLWFLADWRRLGELTGAKIFQEVAALILHGTQQMLSLPDRSLGLARAGLQEEGFACSHQGVDEGMIAKGSTWGSLGWVFAAGTFGVWQGLSEEERARLGAPEV